MVLFNLNFKSLDLANLRLQLLTLTLLICLKNYFTPNNVFVKPTVRIKYDEMMYFCVCSRSEKLNKKSLPHHVRTP